LHVIESAPAGVTAALRTDAGRIGAAEERAG
jgi:hypothetical protein